MDIKICYKATIMQKVWYWHKTSNIEKWNTIESQEIYLGTYKNYLYN